MLRQHCGCVAAQIEATLRASAISPIYQTKHHMASRIDLVTALVRNARTSTEDIEALKAYGWDCEMPLVTLRKTDVLSVLAQFRAGSLTAEEVCNWADRIEGRDDIDCEEDAVDEAIFWLANPSINYPIDIPLCARIEKTFHRP